MACGFPNIGIENDRCAESVGGIRRIFISGEEFSYAYRPDANDIDLYAKVDNITPRLMGTKFKLLHTFREGDAAPNFNTARARQDNGSLKDMSEGTFVIAQDSPEIRAILNKYVGRTADLLIEYKGMKDRWESVRNVRFTNVATESNSRRHTVSWKLEDEDYPPTLIQAQSDVATEELINLLTN
jgi:hypothetical protein